MNVPLAVVADATKKVSEIATILGGFINVDAKAAKGDSAPTSAKDTDAKLSTLQAFMVRHTKGSWGSPIGEPL